MPSEKAHDPEAARLLGDYLDENGTPVKDRIAVRNEAERIAGNVVSLAAAVGYTVSPFDTGERAWWIAVPNVKDAQAILAVSASAEISVMEPARSAGSNIGDPEPRVVPLRFNRLDGTLESPARQTNGLPARSPEAEVAAVLRQVMNARVLRMKGY